MRVDNKKIYVTFDGMEFVTEEAALSHESDLKLVEDKLFMKKMDELITKESIKRFFLKQKCTSCPFLNECSNEALSLKICTIINK